MATLTTTITKVVIYTRVSTERQGKSTLGLQGQLDACLRFAATEGLEVIGTYTDVQSGKSDDNRPQLKAALAAAKKVKGAVLCHKLDRLSRSVEYIAGMMSQGVPFVISELGLGVNPFMLHIYAAMAEQERIAISARTTAALAAARARGTKMGLASDKRSDAKEVSAAGVAANIAEADRHAGKVLPVIKAIQASGKTTLRAIADELNAREVKTARGGTWQATTVMNLLARFPKG